MQLKKIKRAEKKGTESVMDEKFALLFQSSFAVGHGDLVFSVSFVCIILVGALINSFTFCCVSNIKLQSLLIFEYCI